MFQYHIYVLRSCSCSFSCVVLRISIKPVVPAIYFVSLGRGPQHSSHNYEIERIEHNGHIISLILQSYSI
jgi:hypothetical protein